MVGEIFASIGAVKTAFDMAKALQGIHDATQRDRAIIDLQRQILSAQEEQFALAARNRELEKEIADLKSWEDEKRRYKMTSLAPNVIAFAERQDVNDRSPAHYLCANCFAAGRKSFFQQTIRGNRLDRYKCNSCGEEISVTKDGPGHHYSALPPTGRMDR
jgi:DNA-directed RNA polymerase subunit RPC12/RpoP